MLAEKGLENLNQLVLPIMGDLYGLGKTYLHRLTKSGMYEVLKYETTLELLDVKGKEAIFTKKEEVKFLQNNIIAFQDQAWGSGKILLDYQCSPGIPVDFYQFAHKTHILISLRNVMKKGDISKFNIQWKVKDGFFKANGFWSTDINHRTKLMRVRVIFPKERLPLKCMTVESNRQKIKELPHDALVRLPDKRWQVTWEKKNPRLHEHYVMKWEW